MSSVPFTKTSTGFVGTSDGATDLLGTTTPYSPTYAAAGPGNIAQVGQIAVSGTAGKTTRLHPRAVLRNRHRTRPQPAPRPA